MDRTGPHVPDGPPWLRTFIEDVSATLEAKACSRPSRVVNSTTPPW